MPYRQALPLSNLPLSSFLCMQIITFPSILQVPCTPHTWSLWPARIDGLEEGLVKPIGSIVLDSAVAVHSSICNHGRHVLLYSDSPRRGLVYSTRILSDDALCNRLRLVQVISRLLTKPTTTLMSSSFPPSMASPSSTAFSMKGLSAKGSSAICLAARTSS